MSNQRNLTEPIIAGFHPDPSICRVEDDYFLVTSSFEYFPGIPLFHSRDLVNWRQIGHCLTRPSQLPLEGVQPSGGIYAPTIRYHQGVFYVVVTNTTHGGNFIVQTRDPFGEWSEPIWIDQKGIDPSLLFDDDGAVYLSNSYINVSPPPETGKDTAEVWGIQQSQIDIHTGQRLSEVRPIWSGTGGKYPEAPHLYHIGDYYYLLMAEGGTEYGHMATIARSRTPWGPWESCPHNPILSHRSLNSPVQALGHADLVQAHDGSWWLVCLGIRPNGYPPCHHLGRETFLVPLEWGTDGWPQVGNQGRLTADLAGPRLDAHPWPLPAQRTVFNSERLGLEWNFWGNPADDAWALRDGQLQLFGSAAALNSGGAISFVGRRQQHRRCTAALQISFEPEADEEAGLVVWMNPQHHYAIAISRVDGRRVVSVRRQIGSLSAVVACRPCPEGAIILGVDADPLEYRFWYAVDGLGAHALAAGETRYLSTEVAGGFTGVFFGIYASGNGRRSENSARIDWFEYAP